MAAVTELTVRKAEGDLLEVDPLDLGANTPGRRLSLRQSVARMPADPRKRGE